MKPDNYNIPAYQFFLVQPSSTYNRGEHIGLRASNIREDLSNNDSFYKLIPFEEVDGLTIEDLDSIIHGEIFLACYIKIPSLQAFRYHSQILYHVFPNTTRDERKIKEETVIDDFITHWIESQYDDASKTERRVYDCFLTRYTDEKFVKEKH